MTTAIAWLTAVDLPTMDATFGLQTRTDRKYLVPLERLDAVVDTIVTGLGSGGAALEIGGRRSFSYESIYFDTPSRESYLSAARSRPFRFKVRTRSYLDVATSALEVKQRRHGGATDKLRYPYPFRDRGQLNTKGRETISNLDGLAPLVPRLQPFLETRFTRSSLVDHSSFSRITIDTDLTASTADGGILDASHLAVIETKTIADPSPTDHVLWGLGYRPVKFSKYGTSMAALDPSLPANKWNRVLRTYFAWEPASASSPSGNSQQTPGRFPSGDPILMGTFKTKETEDDTPLTREPNPSRPGW